MQYTEHTTADLDAMPTGTALADRSGSVWRKMPNGNWSIRSSGAGVTSGLLALGTRVWRAAPLAPGMVLTDADGDDWEVQDDGRLTSPGGDARSSVKRVQRKWGPLAVRIAAEPEPEPADGTMRPMTEDQARLLTGALGQAVDDMLAKVRQATERHTHPLTRTAGTGDDPAEPTASEQSKAAAWDRLAEHPAFQRCLDDAEARSVPLVQAMADRLDALLEAEGQSKALERARLAADRMRSAMAALGMMGGAES